MIITKLSRLLAALFLTACTSQPEPSDPKSKQADKLKKIDNRKLIKVPFNRRDIIMKGMRGNLISMTNIIDAAANSDFEMVEQLAEEMLFTEKAMYHLSRRGDAGFIELGIQFHTQDVVNLIKAARTKNLQRTLSATAAALKTCNACHASYRLTEWPKNKKYKYPDPMPLPLPKNFDKKQWTR